MIQLIVYSAATGRIRRVIDLGRQVLHPTEHASMANLQPGEAVQPYTKRSGARPDDLGAWQAVVSAACGLIPTPLHPDVEAAALAAVPSAVRAPSDLHSIVDSAGLIVNQILACPDCGDRSEHLPGGHSLVRGEHAIGGTLIDGIYTPPAS